MKTLRSSSPVATRGGEEAARHLENDDEKSVTRRTVTPSAPLLAQKSSIEVGWTGIVQRKDSLVADRRGRGIGCIKRRVYVHYVAHDRRNDEWGFIG